MNKTERRFFGGAIESQERWLNRKAGEGWRLVKTGKINYEFEQVEADSFEYRVEYIGGKTREWGEDYAHFLEECGYRTFFKNINLNTSVGKVIWNPVAEKGARLMSVNTTLGRELLIVEKRNDGSPFHLHTTTADRITYYKTLRKPWLFYCFVFAVLAVLLRRWGLAIPAVLSLIGLIPIQLRIIKIKETARIEQ